MSDWMRGRKPRPDTTAELGVQIGEVHGVTVVFVTGDLDMSATTQMSNALNMGCSLAGNRLVVDVSGLGFMDMAGLRVLVGAHERLLREGRDGIVVRGASGIVRRVFELAGSTPLLDNSPLSGVEEHRSPRVSESGEELENVAQSKASRGRGTAC